MVIVGALYFGKKRLFGMYSFLKEIQLQEGEEQSEIISLLMTKKNLLSPAVIVPIMLKEVINCQFFHLSWGPG